MLAALAGGALALIASALARPSGSPR